MVYQSPIARFLVVLAAFIVVVAGMKAAESLLVPFFLSLFIAIICSPPLLWMRSKGLPTWLSLLAIIFVLIALSVVIGAIIGSAIGGRKYVIIFSLQRHCRWQGPRSLHSVI